MTDPRFRRLFDTLLAVYGPQHWWPGETRFEIMVGAVLTQNTAWSNVEKAIDRLNQARVMEPQAIEGLPVEVLADLIRPAGYFNLKARRLQSLCRFLLEAGGIAALARVQTADLRTRLLDVHGVGPETADDILLYAFERPVFVVDAYTRRLGARLGLLDGSEGYEAVRTIFEAALGPDVETFAELHGLIVMHSKTHCRKRPLCADCRLRGECQYAEDAQGVR